MTQSFMPGGLESENVTLRRNLAEAMAAGDRLRAELAAAQTWHMQYVGESFAECHALDIRRSEMAARYEATIARVRAVITDHDCCNCLVRADGCEHMWNEMREVFRPALDGDTE